MNSVQNPNLGTVACWVVGLQSNCNHRQYENNPASQTGSGLSQDKKFRIPFQYCGVSSIKQIHGTLVPHFHLEEGRNMMRVVKPHCKYRLVPTQLSTEGYRLGTDNMQHPLVSTLLFHQCRVSNLG